MACIHTINVLREEKESETSKAKKETKYHQGRTERGRKKKRHTTAIFFFFGYISFWYKVCGVRAALEKRVTERFAHKTRRIFLLRVHLIFVVILCCSVLFQEWYRNETKKNHVEKSIQWTDTCKMFASFFHFRCVVFVVVRVCVFVVVFFYSEFFTFGYIQLCRALWACTSYERTRESLCNSRSTRFLFAFG